MSSRRRPISTREVMAALETRNIKTLGWRLVQFKSGDQSPQHRIGANGIIGAVEDVVLGPESSSIKELFHPTRGVVRPPGPSNTAWNWLTRTPGVDVTAVFDNNDKCLGASLGFLHQQRIGHVDATYVDLLTATSGTFQGIGRYLRQAQIDRVNKTLRRVPSQEAPMLQIVSLSALPSNVTRGRGAVGFNNKIFVDEMGFTQGSEADARDILLRLDTLYPQLYIASAMTTAVQPMRFVDD